MTKRRGMSLLELSVAGVLLGVLLTVSLQLMGANAAARQAVAHRRTALIEAGNVLERLAAKPWDELTPENALNVELSPTVRSRLTQAQLNVEVTPGGNDPVARRIVVTIHWNNRSGVAARPVRLVAWRYRDAGTRSTKPQSATDDESEN